MATNVPARNFDTRRFTVTAAAELAIQLEATHVIRYIHVHEYGKSVNVRITFSPGGTYSTDNYFTLWGATAWELNDITLYPQDDAGTFFYARSEAGTVTLEVMWAQA